MKKCFLAVLVWIYLPTFAQEVIRVSYADSCIIGDAKLSRPDFLKLNKLCHHQLKEVKSFNIVTVNGSEEKVYHFKGDRWDPKQFKNIPVGSKIYFEEIKGISLKGNFTLGSDITITIN